MARKRLLQWLRCWQLQPPASRVRTRYRRSGGRSRRGSIAFLRVAAFSYWYKVTSTLELSSTSSADVSKPVSKPIGESRQPSRLARASTFPRACESSGSGRRGSLSDISRHGLTPRAHPPQLGTRNRLTPPPALSPSARAAPRRGGEYLVLVLDNRLTCLDN